MISSSKMRDYIGKKREKVCIGILSYRPEIKFENEAFWFVFKSICYSRFSLIFQKKIGGGGENRKEPDYI